MREVVCIYNGDIKWDGCWLGMYRKFVEVGVVDGGGGEEEDED